MQYLEEGASDGGQAAVVPPNQAEVTFRLNVGETELGLVRRFAVELRR